MKKIYCEVVPHDYIQVKVNFEGVDINVVYEDSTHGVYITADKIRKLRKQLKRALIEIEGEKKGDDWFSVGRTVKIIANTSNHYFPIGVNVKLTKEEYPGGMRAEYLDGMDYWLVHKNDCEPAS